MGRKPTQAQRLTYLQETYPLMEDDIALLQRAIARAEQERPELARHFGAFKLYWGLTNEEPPTYQELSYRLGITTKEGARRICYRAGRILRQAKWWRDKTPG